MEYILIAFAAAFALIWLITYIPTFSTLFGKCWSPRLWFCKTLIPMDVSLTLVLICGGWIGITTSQTGIGLVTYNVFTGIGISVAVVSIRKFLIPRWEKQFATQKETYVLNKRQSRQKETFA
jgi:hypothetical protein